MARVKTGIPTAREMRAVGKLIRQFAPYEGKSELDCVRELGAAIVSSLDTHCSEFGMKEFRRLVRKAKELGFISDEKEYLMDMIPIDEKTLRRWAEALDFSANEEDSLAKEVTVADIREEILAALKEG